MNVNTGEVLATASAIEAEDYFSEYEALETYGLNAPQKSVTLTLSDGSVKKLMIGNYNDIVGYYYMMVEGDSNLYLVDGTLLNAFEVSYTELEFIEEETEEVTESTESMIEE